MFRNYKTRNKHTLFVTFFNKIFVVVVVAFGFVVLGHSDVVMGLVSLNSETLHSRLRFLQNCKY